MSKVYKEKPKMPRKPKYIETPDALWQLFEEYRAWVKENPYQVEDYVGGAGKRVYRQKERPLTVEGMNVYAFDRGIMSDLKDYINNRDGRYEAYVTTVSRIREAVRLDQVSGGMVGIYNANLTARLNGITENTHTTTTIHTVTLGG
jgi:hypothetical protein